MHLQTFVDLSQIAAVLTVIWRRLGPWVTQHRGWVPS
jgi:hypothetical protein